MKNKSTDRHHFLQCQSAHAYRTCKDERIEAYQTRAVEILSFQAETLLLVIPSIFVLLGLLDVWVPREQMMRFKGPGSGAKGHRPLAEGKMPRDICAAIRSIAGGE